MRCLILTLFVYYRSDSGTLSNINHLVPATFKFKFGDLAGNFSFSFGKVRCYGKYSTTTHCELLMQMPHKIIACNSNFMNRRHGPFDF